MCGIFGLVLRERCALAGKSLRGVVDTLFALSETRGKEAAGLAVASGNRIQVLKRNIGGRALSRLPQIRAMLDATAEDHGGLSLIGHTRMVTNGAAHHVGNNQPVLRGSLVCIHNGIITNVEQLWRQFPELCREHEVDTEVLVALIEQDMHAGKVLLEATQDAFARLVGANTVALLDGRSDGIVLATSNGSLYCCANAEAGVAVFASERYILEQTILTSGLKAALAGRAVEQVSAGFGALLGTGERMLQYFRLDATATEALSTITRRDIVDCGSSSDYVPPALGVPNVHRLGAIESRARIDFDQISRLRRCSRCLLPETFPFLDFDEAGVCSVCRSHRTIAKPGKQALLAEIAVANGTPRCLAPVSGGRDSCFGLHYMVHELGIRPVTYTYDWGMVTDLARRNISRMCGALGLEHVLVSADIGRKRRFIRLNVSAWLRRPHLGTVPLFMAGDKQFFYYAEKLRRQMQLDSILFSMNPLERTDFKVAFCGLDEGYDKHRHYDPAPLNKLRLAAFYARQFLVNPAYLNASLADTLAAYWSYYLLPKGFRSLFDYIPWHEAEVERTLIGGYDWETSSDSRSTWRIGDGTAAFYNYIYLRVAGFTEHDTFRSNQIRAGLIDRDWALQRINEENQPRIESLATYFDTIDLDAPSALDRVNAMARLY